MRAPGVLRFHTLFNLKSCRALASCWSGNAYLSRTISRIGEIGQDLIPWSCNSFMRYSFEIKII